MVFIDGTVVGVALPALQSSLHATITDVQWVIESYALLLGALLLTEIVSAIPFLQIALSWNNWIPGILILVAAGIYSRARGGRAALLGTGEA